MSIQTVKLLCCGLDEEEGGIILRGRLDPESLDTLLVDDYQRGVMPAKVQSILKGFQEGSPIPDVELGMRGWKERPNGDATLLLDPVYIVDGLQRVSAARLFRTNGGMPRLGAAVHFNTTKEWETERFKILNFERTAVSSNVRLRNDRTKYPVLEALYSMSEDDPQFVLRGAVCWEQRKLRQHLITAVTLLRVAGVLHSHIGPGMTTDIEGLIQGVQRIFEELGRQTFRDNVRAYFALLDECWGVRTVVFTEAAPHLKNTFLITLAKVLSNHENFWRATRLSVEAALNRKLRTFPLRDPHISHMCSVGGRVDTMLYQYIVDHLNKGKRTKKLRERRITS